MPDELRQRAAIPARQGFEDSVEVWSPEELRSLDRSMSRAASAPRIDGNRVSLQFDGPQTFDAWLEAIDGAQQFIHFENYILRDDRIGRTFREALIQKARAGISVRVLYDWFGCWATPPRYWRPFRDAGIEVRAFNPPSIRDPLGLFQRDHRKMVCVDGDVAFIGGFCVGAEWAGGPNRPPWRDTGVAMEGPAAAAAARAFERIWAELGTPVPEELRRDPQVAEAVGTTPVWLIEGVPWRSRVYRATQLVAAIARERIWITDPYFVAPRPVAESLASAARDGVDVRILLPGHNNWPLVGSLARGGYRALLEAGVRIFEWQGPMIHAKTSVADGVWARVGSSNLNSASLLGNWEIDMGIVDRELALQMEGLYLADLASAVEIFLPGKAPPLRTPADPPPARRTPLDAPTGLQERLEYWRSEGGASGGLRLADLVRAGSAFGDAIAGHRILGREDRRVLGTVAAALIVLATVAGFFPRAIGWTVAGVVGWMGVVTAVRAFAQYRRARRETERVRDGDSGQDEPS